LSNIIFFIAKSKRQKNYYYEAPCYQPNLGAFFFANPTYKIKAILQLRGDQTTSTNDYDCPMKNKEQLQDHIGKHNFYPKITLYLIKTI
jgi:hypothetical protein